MSSILDALKKAQQESAAVDEGPVSWPTPVSALVAGRRPRRWWWIASAGVVCLLGILGWFWLTAPDDTPVSAPMPATPTAPSVPSAPSPKPAIPVKERMKRVPPPVRTIRPHPPASPPAVKPRPLPTPGPVAGAREPVAPPGKAPPPDTRPSDRRVAPVPPAASPAPAPGPPAKTETKPDNRPDKDVRRDPRIDLQALVWAPEAADRFVVINNQLVKQGGSVDTFVVVEINRDDVLIAEGTERWYEPFSIR